MTDDHDPRDDDHGPSTTSSLRSVVPPDRPRPEPASPMDAQRAECQLLGAIIDDIEPADALRVASTEHDLEPRSFANRRARAVFSAMLELDRRREPLDLVSIGLEVHARGEAPRFDLDQVSPEHADRVGLWISAQLRREHSARHLAAFAGQVAHAARVRRAHELARSFALDIEQAPELRDPDTWDEFTAGPGAELAECLAATRSSAPTESARAVANATLDQIEREAEGDSLSLSTGFPDLDAMISGRGPKPGALVVVSARKKVGKTAFAWAMTKPQLFARTPRGELTWGPRSKPAPVFWACGEMTNTQLMNRWFADLATIDTRALAGADRDWLRHERPRLELARDLVAQAPLTFAPDKHSNALDRVLAGIRRWRRSHPVDPKTGLQIPALAVLDYLQRFTWPGTDRLNANDRTTRMLLAVKSLALELGIVIVLLSQLNREADKRENHRPRSADNRDSGSIEQEADTLIGLYRSSVYAEVDDPDEWGVKQRRYLELKQGFTTTATDGQAHRASIEHSEHRAEMARLRREIDGAEIHIMDNRHGPTGMVCAEFIGLCQRWQPLHTHLRIAATG